MIRSALFFQREHHHAITEAQSFSQLSTVALDILQKMPQPIGQVCGPISNGGLGSIKQNLAEFSRHIWNLIDQGHNIFNQMPFEEHFFRITGGKWGKRINDQLLNDFYLPIFESSFISTLYFIPDWQSSAGAQWEHDQAARLNISIQYL